MRSMRLLGRDGRDAFAKQLVAGEVVIRLKEARQFVCTVVMTRISLFLRFVG